MAYEIGIPYVLTGPDGTRAVFNDRTDPDFVGYLNAEDGVSGMGGADVRESADTLVEADGGVNGMFYSGRRPFVLSGFVDPNTDIVTMNQRADKVLRAANALRGDATLVWQESHRPQTGVWLRRNVAPTLNGRLPKRFVLPMVAADDRIVGTAINTATIVPGGLSGIIGYSSPYANPYGESLNVSGQVSVINSGTTGARPWFTLAGPITNPRILNNTTGEEIRLTYSLGVGETLTIETHPARRSVLLGGTSSRWGAVDNANTTWWELQPGANDIRLLSLSFSPGAQLTINWRDTWP